MDMMCSLFSKMHQNSTKIYGMCYEKLKKEQIINSRRGPELTTTIVANLKTIFEKSELYNHNSVIYNRNRLTNQTHTMDANKLNAAKYDDFGAAIFIVVVICFYSLSIVFMVIINVKFRVVFKRNTGGFCCCENKHDLYDAQKDETKNTIHMIFNDSSRLLTSVVLPASLVTNLTNLKTIPTMNPQNSRPIVTKYDTNDDDDIDLSLFSPV